MKRFVAILGFLTLGLGRAPAQRGVGTRAVMVPSPMSQVQSQSVPTLTLIWDPNMNALDTVIISSTNLLLPPAQWNFRARIYNDVTNAVTFPRTNAVEFFRAYSE